MQMLLRRGQSHLWEPREERFDKFKPNNNKICEYEERYVVLRKISEIKMFDKYYQKHR